MARPELGARLKANGRGVWEIHWNEGGQPKRASTRTKDAAQAADALREFKLGLDRERAGAGAATVAGLLEAYWTEHVKAKVLSRDTAGTIRNHLVAHFGAIHPAEITPKDVRAYVRRRKAGEIGGRGGKGASDPTIRRDLVMLVAALNHAVKEGAMKAGEVPAIALPPGGEPRARWLTDAEVAALFAAAEASRHQDGRMARVERWLFLAYFTGRRKAAIERLTWDRVDFTINAVDFDEPGRRKTKKRRGVAYMNLRLRAALERASAQRREGCPWVLDHPGDTRQAFETIRKRAGLGPEVTCHIVKHTAATHMLRRGVALWDVAGALATTPRTIQDTYGKHVPEAQRKAMEALG